MPLNCQSVNDALFLLRGIKCGYSQTSRDETHLSDFLISSGCVFVVTWHMAARFVTQACWSHREEARQCGQLGILHQSGIMEGDGLRGVQSRWTCRAHMDQDRELTVLTGQQPMAVKWKPSKLYLWKFKIFFFALQSEGGQSRQKLFIIMMSNYE